MPIHNRHQTNLSVRYLLILEPSRNKLRLAQAVKRAEESAKFARNWRDKYIAHNDLDHVAGRKLAFATRKRVSRAIVSIHDVLRWIDARNFDSEMYLIDTGDGDALEVMAILAGGLRMEEFRSKELDAGRFPDATHRDFGWMGEGLNPSKRYQQQKYALPKPLKKRSTLPS
jgi:hypothetical protein